jgi:hypothetical protein
MTAVTQWFRGTNPRRKGVYEIQNGLDRRIYSFWNGCGWMVGSFSVEKAMEWNETPSNNQSKTWRGLVKEPK